MTNRTVTIRQNEFDEFEVPTAFMGRAYITRPTSIYYTDDKDDAIGTAQYHFGSDTKIVVRRGTYENLI